MLVLSDNGASQEGGPLGFVNAMGPYNFKPEPMAEKLARIDDIGGPDTHSNFPQGWAMASNTPLRRYKQNTHGGGIRDPLVISWPQRHCRARRSAAAVLPCGATWCRRCCEVLELEPPAAVQGVAQMPIEGESFAASLHDAAAPARARPQYFEMFGHRGLWHDGWKAVAFHPPGTPFEDDRWELFHLDRDFSETDDLAAREPERLKALVDVWWQQAEAHQVLPLDDRFGPRFVESAAPLPRAAPALRVPRRRRPHPHRRGARRARPRLPDRGRSLHRRPRHAGRAASRTATPPAATACSCATAGWCTT